MKRAEATILALQAEMYAQVALIEAMKATNVERESQGYSLAYDEAAFMQTYTALTTISSNIMELSNELGG